MTEDERDGAESATGSASAGAGFGASEAAPSDAGVGSASEEDGATAPENEFETGIEKAEHRTEAVASNAAEMAIGMAKGAAGTLRAGAFAVRDVHNASRQSAGARAQARTIREALEADQRTLDHRRDIEASFEDIVSEQSEIVARSRAAIESGQQKIDGLSEERSALVADLEELKASNVSAIRPYRRLAETSKDELDDAQRMLVEAKRAVKSAEAQLEDAKERRDSSYASASRSLDNSQTRQRKVQDELKKLQSSGGAQAAIAQLQSDNVAALAGIDAARAEVDRAAKDGQNAVSNAQTHLWTQNQSLSDAQAKHDAALAKHKSHKAEHDRLADEAKAKESELQERIDAKKRELEEIRAEVDEAQKALDEAQGLIDEARHIHSTPEETARLEQSIAAQQADLEEANSEVEHLATAEKQLRQATLGSRVALIAVAIVALLVAALLAMSCTAG